MYDYEIPKLQRLLFLECTYHAKYDTLRKSKENLQYF